MTAPHQIDRRTANDTTRENADGENTAPTRRDVLKQTTAITGAMAVGGVALTETATATTIEASCGEKVEGTVTSAESDTITFKRKGAKSATITACNKSENFTTGGQITFVVYAPSGNRIGNDLLTEPDTCGVKSFELSEPGEYEIEVVAFKDESLPYSVFIECEKKGNGN